METKSWQAFEGKIRVLKQHLQLLDLSLILANNKAIESKDSGKSIREILGAKKGKHLQLNIPNKSKDISRTFITSRKKLNEHAIIELYRIYSDYIRNVIAEMMHKKPLLLIELLKASELISNKSKMGKKRYSIDAEDILKIGNFDSLVKEISMQLYRNLENERSTTKLLDKMIKATHISIEEKGRVVFDNWLFASSPSVNLFTHPVYDVRVEF